MPATRCTKIFDPKDGFAPLTDPVVVTDATVVCRDGRWWMFAAGKVMDRPGIQLFSASLPEGTTLSASGWTLTADAADPSKLAMLAGQDVSGPWDLAGGRHCPSYVKGWDAERRVWVERIYYAGGAAAPWGPYTIGYLEWDGVQWAQQAAPVFSANEEWEQGSVYEPNLIYDEGRWKMWYVAGSNAADYLVQGYAESEDGRNWSGRKIFCAAEEKVFDFCVIPVESGYEAVYSRVWLGSGPAPEWAGLWWRQSRRASSELTDWSEPVQILKAEAEGWYGGPWKPSVIYDAANPDRMFVFFDGLPPKTEDRLFAFAFTMGCLELDRPVGL